MATHGACGKSWTGMRAEHCPACHETFNGTRAGDMHRVGDFNDGSRRCLTPEEMLGKGLVLNARGLWGRPGPEGPHPAAAARICGPDGQEWV